MAALAVAACASGGMTAATRGQSTTKRLHRPVDSSTSSTSPRPRLVPYARLLRSAQGSAPTGFVPAAVWHGQTAAWIGRSPSGVSLLSFDQRLVKLTLHSGTVDAGSSGWRYGPEVASSERRHRFSAFNGGFKFDVGAGGFMSFGRVATPLRAGLASIVTYTDGYTDIGSWRREVPAKGRSIASVRQNLTLLIDHGQAAASVDCVSCWGATLGAVADPARSALGVTGDGRLIWAGGEHATVAQLADVLLGARVVRAVELDINPEWVAAYLYGHRGGRGSLAPVPIVPGQPGVPGQFLTPYSRDFFTVLTR
ncbi:MAG: hypothetical protein ACR2NR_12280 [Solirubrobacteraceae bacterium]